MRKLIVTVFFFLTATMSFAATMNSPVGYWKQYDDKTGDLQSIVQIYKNKDGALNGKVIAGFEMNGKAPNAYCDTCPGKFRRKRIVGLDILWNMHYKNNYWQGGRILDPNNGNIYRCEMRLAQDGNRLNVRGYIGISLFGRTQTWVRVPQAQLKKVLSKAFPTPKALSH